MAHDNRNHIGPNWTGKAYRSMAEAYPRTNGPLYVPFQQSTNSRIAGHVTRKQKAKDIAAMAALVAIMGTIAFLGHATGF